MATLHPLVASRYIDLRSRSKHIECVRQELDVVINAVPTQINPTERERYLETLLFDLRCTDDAVWMEWPDDSELKSKIGLTGSVYLFALTAVKSLGRNPIGSETLLTTPHLSTLLHHTGLPFRARPTPVSRVRPSPSSPQALEALRILANLLVLHSAGRNRFANFRGATAIARALAGKDASGNLDDLSEDLDRIFLLGRIGFLVTMERKQAVHEMVDKEDLINSLVYRLSSILPVPAHFAALSELLKLVNNVLRFYPYESTSTDEELWDDRFDALLYPTLVLLHQIPFTDLSPPLTHTIHVLLSIPFLPRLLSTWHSMPEVPLSTPPSSSVRAFLTKIGGRSYSSRRSSTDSSLSSGAPGRTKSPHPVAPQSTGDAVGRHMALPSRKNDPTALPLRLTRVLEEFFETYLPYLTMPDEELQPGLVLDEMLPPPLLLLTRAAAASDPMRDYLKDQLLPPTLDRSPGAGPLESRKGLLGNLLRLMAGSNHIQARDTAGELLLAVCHGDASGLSVEIGYGSAAGLLFRKGVSGPPPARFEDINEDPSQYPFTTAVQAEERHPITSLRPGTNMTSSPDGMTEEEKEREAERLFVLLDRMEKNPIISASSGDGEKKGINQMMREKMERGQSEGWEEQERRRVEEEEDRDEAEARQEMEAYRRRVGRS